MPDTQIEITADSAEWNSDDMLRLRNFLETPTGKKLLPCLLNGTPILLSHGGTNAILIRNGEVRGVQLVAKAFLELAYPSPKLKIHKPWPDLEDDSAWADGKKANPEPEQ